VCLEEGEKVSERLNDHGAELSGHDSSNGREELLDKLCAVVLARPDKVLPVVGHVLEYLGTCGDPPVQGKEDERGLHTY